MGARAVPTFAAATTRTASARHTALPAIPVSALPSRCATASPDPRLAARRRQSAPAAPHRPTANSPAMTAKERWKDAKSSTVAAVAADAAVACSPGFAAAKSADSAAKACP